MIDIDLRKENLAESIANLLPISTEDAEIFIEGVENGYAIGEYYPYALAVRDRAMIGLSKDKEKLERLLGKYYGHRLYDEHGNKLY